MKSDIIILHGWGLSGSRFSSLREELEKRGHRVWSPDFPGFGKEAMPRTPYHLEDYVLFLKKFISDHKIMHPGLVGHSFGGRVALKYDFLYPMSCSWIVLTGTPGFSPVPSGRLKVLIAIAQIGNAFLSLPVLSYLKNFARKSYYYLVGAREFTRAVGTMQETFKNIVAENLVPCMEKMSVPCYLIWGEKDLMVPVSIAKRMNYLIDKSHLAIHKDIGHNFPYQSAKEFVWELENFSLI